MKKSYINGVGCISAQSTANGTPFLEAPISYDSVMFRAVDPDYKKYIKPSAMRRMSRSVKMGISASSIALNETGIKMPDAIITGTGRGCRQDSEIFLEMILENDESLLTPIKFIQSTHNTVGGQIALRLGCHAYNFTYVQSAVSFESALMDAHWSILEEPAVKNVLVGGVDEVAKNHAYLLQQNGHLKQEENRSNLDLLERKTKGCLEGEGATFFVLSDEKRDSSYATLDDVEIFNQVSPKELEDHIDRILKANKLKKSDIDAIVLGINGDVEFDHYYEKLQSKMFKDTLQLYYKHLAGEHPTVSAFGTWMASNILKLQTIPEIVKLNDVKLSRPIKNILLYNQYRGRNHSVVLMSACL